jgi:hypothetical protein
MDDLLTTDGIKTADDFVRYFAWLLAPDGAVDMVLRHQSPSDLSTLADAINSQAFDAAIEAGKMRAMLSARAQTIYSDPRLGAEYMRANKGEPTDRKGWRVYHDGRPVGYGHTGAEALLDAIENRARTDGRAAERAEIVADLKARADQRYQQAEVCKRDGGNWEMVAAKATEAEACRDIVRRRTKIEAAPEPSTETPA